MSTSCLASFWPVMLMPGSTPAGQNNSNDDSSACLRPKVLAGCRRPALAKQDEVMTQQVLCIDPRFQQTNRPLHQAHLFKMFDSFAWT